MEAEDFGACKPINEEIEALSGRKVRATRDRCVRGLSRSLPCSEPELTLSIGVSRALPAGSAAVPRDGAGAGD